MAHASPYIVVNVETRNENNIVSGCSPKAHKMRLSISSALSPEECIVLLSQGSKFRLVGEDLPTLATSPVSRIRPLYSSWTSYRGC